MTLKILEETLPPCQDCNGEKVVTVGEYDNEQVVDCICVKGEKADAEAESLEGANIEE